MLKVWWNSKGCLNRGFLDNIMVLWSFYVKLSFEWISDSTTCFLVQPKTRYKVPNIHLINHLVTQPAITCSKLTIKTLEQRCEICSELTSFIVNFEHISHLCSSVSIVNYEHVIAGWNFFINLIELNFK